MIREPEDVSNRFSLFDHRHPEERIVSPTAPAFPPAASPSTAAPAAPVIATRKSCNPDGIGLSHYVLMDKKAAK